MLGHYRNRLSFVLGCDGALQEQIVLHFVQCWGITGTDCPSFCAVLGITGTGYPSFCAVLGITGTVSMSFIKCCVMQ